MNDRLGSSPWTVAEARSVVARLRNVAAAPDHAAGIELFAALCAYLDELTGGRGFDHVLTEPARSAFAQALQRVLGRPPGDGIRLGQPVDASVTLAEGRGLADELAAAEGWVVDLGLALRGLYEYLDHLHGGPGAFQVLLTPEERTQVVQSAAKR